MADTLLLTKQTHSLLRNFCIDPADYLQRRDIAKHLYQSLVLTELPKVSPQERIQACHVATLLTGGVAVEGEAVGGAAGDAAEDTSGGESDDAAAESNGAGVALEGSEVGTETSNVRAGHGSAGDGVLERLISN